MNVRYLRRNIGHLFRLRPMPQRIGANGQRLADIDDSWRLEEVRERPTSVRLKNTATGHVVDLQSDNINRFQSSGHLILRCQLALMGAEIQIEPLLDAGSGPLPIASYQRHVHPMTTAQHTSFVAHLCDGCTAAVQFRPITAVKLLDSPDPRGRSEQFCPPCARRRGISVLLPEGMTQEVLYAEGNPTFRYHVTRLLKTWLLRALSSAPELGRLGVTNVGAAIGGYSFTLLVSGTHATAASIEVTFVELEALGLSSEQELYAELRARTIQALGQDSAC